MLLSFVRQMTAEQREDFIQDLVLEFQDEVDEAKEWWSVMGIW